MIPTCGAATDSQRRSPVFRIQRGDLMSRALSAFLVAIILVGSAAAQAPPCPVHSVLHESGALDPNDLMGGFAIQGGPSAPNLGARFHFQGTTTGRPIR